MKKAQKRVPKRARAKKKKQLEAQAPSAMFDHVAQLTGLPQSNISAEMTELLVKVGADPRTATLDDLRKATAALLAEVMGVAEA